MKHFLNIAFCVALTVILTSCDRTRRSPGRAYAPDMAYSVAYETQSPTERLEKKGVHYTGLPVPGTVARGEMAAYPFKNDSVGYAQSATVKNPLAGEKINMKEAERLYLVNCGICHGAKLDGNGPLFNGGNGPYTAAPRNFMEPAMKAMPEGTMFHSVTYGIRQMGSYASQLNTKQRWEVIAYVKSKQFPAGSTPDTTAKQAADTTGATTVAKAK